MIGIKKQPKWKFIVILAATIGIMWYLLSKVSFSDFADAVASYRLWVVALGLLVYMLLNVWRAIRFKVLLKHKLPFRKLMHIVLIHNLFNNLIPMRAGEISFIYLVKTQKIRGTQGLGSLIVGRVFDFIAISLVYLVSMLFARSIPVQVYNILWIVAVFFFALLVFLLLLVFKGMIFVRALKKAFHAFRLEKHKAFRFILVKSEETIEGITVLKSPKLLSHAFILSIFIWATYYGLVYLLISELGIGLGFWAVSLGATFALLTTVLPVHGFAGFGSIEGAWAIVFVALGVSTALAVLSGFVFHLINILYYVILGVPALLLWKK